MPIQCPNNSLAQLPGYSIIAKTIADRPLSQFSQVASFYFCCKPNTDGSVSPMIDLVLQEPDAPNARIGLRFKGVENVEFSGFGLITGLFFQKLEHPTLERSRFEVGDYEDERIHLYCKEILLFDPESAA